MAGISCNHDGGQEASINLFRRQPRCCRPVICQTGCISHNAYWRVKDHCKRTGKPCVFIDNPSISSLACGPACLPGLTLPGPGWSNGRQRENVAHWAADQYQSGLLLACRALCYALRGKAPAHKHHKLVHAIRIVFCYLQTQPCLANVLERLGFPCQGH